MLVFRRFNDWLSGFIQTVCQYLLSVFVIRIWCNNWSSAFDEDQYLTCKTVFVQLYSTPPSTIVKATGQQLNLYRGGRRRPFHHLCFIHLVLSFCLCQFLLQFLNLFQEFSVCSVCVCVCTQLTITQKCFALLTCSCLTQI